ncbi:MAG: Ppx/GppA phosphatase family protein [Candidatus Thermoplasmatota archaeon]
MVSPFPLRVAVLDVGSNAIRAFACEFTSATSYRVLLSNRSPVRLGHSVFQEGAIAKTEMDEAVGVLAAFRLEAEALGIRHIRAVATSAVREAANRAQFQRRAQKEASIELEAITGAEEARLIHLAVSMRIPLDKPTLLMDLGGGSLEVTLVDGKGILWSESHPIGAVRLLEEFESCRGDAKKFTRLIQQTVEAFRIPTAATGRRASALAATGGNIEELARLLGANGGDGVVEIKVDALEKIADDMARLDVPARIQKFGIRPDRADVIVPAAYVHIHIARLAGVKTIVIPKVGLKEGVAWDLLDSVAIRTDQARRHTELVRDGALALGRRFQFEEPHGVQVARLALELFDRLKPLHGLGAEERDILAAAAILHDVGRFIGDRGHHKHSHYLIAASDIPGLGPRETELVAQVARYHRRSEPSVEHEPFARLHVADRKRVEKLAALLRVADALDREHKGAVQELKVRRSKSRLTLTLVGAPGSDFLLEQWAVQQKGGLFTRLWGLPIEVTKT